MNRQCKSAYGWNRTIHGSKHLNVEVDDNGQVVAVWFRCMALPFDQQLASPERATEMRIMYERLGKSLDAVHVSDIK